MPRCNLALFSVIHASKIILIIPLLLSYTFDCRVPKIQFVNRKKFDLFKKVTRLDFNCLQISYIVTKDLLLYARRLASYPEKTPALVRNGGCSSSLHTIIYVFVGTTIETTLGQFHIETMMNLWCINMLLQNKKILCWSGSQMKHHSCKIGKDVNFCSKK